MIEAIKKALAVSVEKVETAFESALLLIWLRNELSVSQDKPFIAFRNNLAHGFELLQSDVRAQFNVRLKGELDFSNDNILKKFLKGVKEKASQKSTGRLSLVQKQQCLHSIWTMMAEEPTNHYALLFHIVIYFEATHCEAIRSLRNQIVHPTFSQTLEHTLSILYQSAKAIDWDELMLAEIGEAAEKAYLEYAASVTNVVDTLAKKQARLPNFVERLPTMDAVTPWNNLSVKEKVALCGKDYIKELKRCELTLKMANGRIEQNIIAAMKERVFEASELDAFSEVNWLAHMHEMKRENVLLAFLNTEKILLNKAQIKTLLLLISDQQIDFSEGSQFNKLREKLSAVFRKKECRKLFLAMYTQNVLNAHTLEEGASKDAYEFIVDLFKRPSGVYVTLAVADTWTLKDKYDQVFGSMFEYFSFVNQCVDIERLVEKVSTFIEEDRFFVLNQFLAGAIGSPETGILKEQVLVDVGRMIKLMDMGASISVVSEAELKTNSNILHRLTNKHYEIQNEEIKLRYFLFLKHILENHAPEALHKREMDQVEIPIITFKNRRGAENVMVLVSPSHLSLLFNTVFFKWEEEEQQFFNYWYSIPMATYLVHPKLFRKYLESVMPMPSMYAMWKAHKQVNKIIVKKNIPLIEENVPLYALPEFIRTFALGEGVFDYDMDLPAFYKQMVQGERGILSVPRLKKHIWLLQLVRLHAAELHTVVSKWSQKIFDSKMLPYWVNSVLKFGQCELAAVLRVDFTIAKMFKIYSYVIKRALKKCLSADAFDALEESLKENITILELPCSAESIVPVMQFRRDEVISKMDSGANEHGVIQRWIVQTANTADTVKWVDSPKKLEYFFYDCYGYKKFEVMPEELKEMPTEELEKLLKAINRQMKATSKQNKR